MHRKTHYTETPIKPLRVYEEMNAVFPRDTVFVTTIGLSQIAGAQFLHVYGPRQWINCGQAGPLGWTVPAALSGDYDFQFLIEELAVGAQFRLPYVQVLVNNSYLGLIRQSQRGFEMDFCVQLAFDNQNVEEPALQGYGVDHMKVVEGLGCKALRVTDPEKIQDALRQAQQMARQYRVPVAARARKWPACSNDRRTRHAQICRQPVDAVHRSAVAGAFRACGAGRLLHRGAAVSL